MLIKKICIYWRYQPVYCVNVQSVLYELWKPMGNFPIPFPTTWDGAKTLVNNEIKLPFPQLVGISEPSRVWLTVIHSHFCDVKVYSTKNPGPLMYNYACKADVVQRCRVPWINGSKKGVAAIWTPGKWGLYSMLLFYLHVGIFVERRLKRPDRW